MMVSDIEKVEYTRRYPHTAHELNDGITRQSRVIRMYAAGGVVHCMVMNKPFDQLPPEYRSVFVDNHARLGPSRGNSPIPVSALPPGQPWTGHGIHAHRTFALITFLSVTDVDINAYASSESTA